MRRASLTTAATRGPGLLAGHHQPFGTNSVTRRRLYLVTGLGSGATADGVLTNLEFQAFGNFTGVVFTASLNVPLQTATIRSISSSFTKTTDLLALSGLNLTVQAGDFIGVYSSSASSGSWPQMTFTAFGNPLGNNNYYWYAAPASIGVGSDVPVSPSEVNSHYLSMKAWG